MKAGERQLDPFEDLDSFVKEMQRWADEDTRRLRGLNDITPWFIAVDAAGLSFLAVVADPLDSEESKDALARSFYELVREHDATRFAWVSASWYVHSETEEQAREIRAWREAHPGASLEHCPYVKEATQITAGEWTGRVANSTTIIHRLRGRAALGSWRTVETPWPGGDGDAAGLSGRFVDLPMAGVTGRVLLSSDDWRQFVRSVSQMSSLRGVVDAWMEARGLTFERLFELGSDSPELGALRDAVTSSPVMQQIDALASEYGLRR